MLLDSPEQQNQMVARHIPHLRDLHEETTAMDKKRKLKQSWPQERKYHRSQDQK